MASGSTSTITLHFTFDGTEYKVTCGTHTFYVSFITYTDDGTFGTHTVYASSMCIITFTDDGTWDYDTFVCNITGIQDHVCTISFTEDGTCVGTHMFYIIDFTFDFGGTQGTGTFTDGTHPIYREALPGRHDVGTFTDGTSLSYTFADGYEVTITGSGLLTLYGAFW